MIVKPGTETRTTNFKEVVRILDMLFFKTQLQAVSWTSITLEFSMRATFWHRCDLVDHLIQVSLLLIKLHLHSAFPYQLYR